jgi:GDPmannose 4,6-dehydratase
VRRVLITGIAGQDGSYLAEHLAAAGDAVFGLARPGGSTERIAHLEGSIQLVEGNLLDETSLVSLLTQVAPEEVYNLAGFSFVPGSFSAPVANGELNGLCVPRLLEAIRRVDPRIRFYQASSSETFGGVAESPQEESTPFQPRTPYGAAKLYAYWTTVAFRRTYGMYAVSGILYNHESPRRRPEFVTRKITLAAARIAAGLETRLALGDQEARRDWGFAGDYVRAMPLMLRQGEPRDYVIGTGESHSVREFVEEAFSMLGLDWQRHVVSDPSLTRPGDVRSLVANPRRAREELGWEPRVRFRELIRMMVKADVERVRKECEALPHSPPRPPRSC